MFWSMSKHPIKVNLQIYNMDPYGQSAGLKIHIDNFCRRGLAQFVLLVKQPHFSSLGTKGFFIYREASYGARMRLCNSTQPLPSNPDCNLTQMIRNVHYRETLLRSRGI
jgi:hypothetical protein